MTKPNEYISLLKSLKLEWQWLLKYALKYKYQIAFYTLVGVVSIVMGFGTSVISKFLVDAVVGHDATVMLQSGIIVISVALFQVLMNLITSRISSVVGSRLNNEIRSSIYKHIVFAKWESINKYHSGELINRLEGDVGAISNSIVTFIPDAITRLLQFVGCLVIVCYYDPIMAVLALMGAPVMLLSAKVSAKMIRKYNQESRNMNGKIISFTEETVQNLQTIKAFDLTYSHGKKFRVLLDNYRTLRLQHEKFTLMLTGILSIIGLIVSYSCYGWGIWRLWSGSITYGTMILFLQLSGKLTSAFSALASLAPGAISIATAAGRLMELTELPRELDEDKELVEEIWDVAHQEGVSVQARLLSYVYPDGHEYVLKENSFEVHSGETIGIIGPSGEGKTTLLRLLLGLLKPSSGELFLETKDGIKIPLSESTRRFCSYIPQENAIFSGTIADNLRVVVPEADEETMINVLKQAEAWEFISRLPNGINTVIEENGINFSDGQIQRICIARALLRNSPVLIMDEATSALDTDTESRVLKNIMTADKMRTCILTSHRPSMLKYCDRVYRIDSKGVLTIVS